MGSPLESAIKKQVAAAFKGKLLKCTLRRVGAVTVDDFGDPIASTPSTWQFDGIVDKFNAAFAAQAGIAVTDVRILIIAGSLATTPEKDDQVKVRDEWYQLRTLVERDPANATYVFSGFKIKTP